jgi:hypothetical protein
MSTTKHTPPKHEQRPGGRGRLRRAVAECRRAGLVVPDAGVAVDSIAGALAVFRAMGWTVAVHNDYRQHGRLMTFWLLTHAESGRFAKGEGYTDAEALAAVSRAVQELPALRDGCGLGCNCGVCPP